MSITKYYYMSMQDDESSSIEDKEIFSHYNTDKNTLESKGISIVGYKKETLFDDALPF